MDGRHRYSDLMQGGLEIPCDLCFYGDVAKIIKLKRVLEVEETLTTCYVNEQYKATDIDK